MVAISVPASTMVSAPGSRNASKIAAGFAAAPLSMTFSFEPLGAFYSSVRIRTTAGMPD
jgi:hypothetical protein